MGVRILILFTALALSSCCEERRCIKYGKVKVLGQCLSPRYIYFNECSALTDAGVNMSRSTPFVVGEEVCEEWK